MAVFIPHYLTVAAAEIRTGQCGRTGSNGAPSRVSWVCGTKHELTQPVVKKVDLEHQNDLDVRSFAVGDYVA